MAAIQDSPYPLVFKVDNADGLGFDPLPDSDVHIRTAARALDGMQKEALVQYGPTGTAWRMVCDEGPYLNGTDLAPFPLAFFTAGLVFSYFCEVQAIAKQKGITIKDLELIQDNQYTMEGSATRGDMIGGALPVGLHAKIDADASEQQLMEVIYSALPAASGDALLRSVFTSEFTLTLNGERRDLGRVAAWKDDPRLRPGHDLFDTLAPASGAEYPDDIIVKGDAAQSVFDKEGGAGSSLQAEQKRTLHVRGICRLRDDGLKQCVVQLFKPIGSMFTFLSDDSKAFGGQERAPSGLAYLSAGIAFCYMTQIGRYAHIVKLDMQGYQIMQDTWFSRPGASGDRGKPATAEPVRTHVFLDMGAGETDEVAQQVVDMSEQTCFLHAACRTPLKTRIKVN